MVSSRPQIAHFGQTRRVVAVDLRGHGASDAPEQEYIMAGFADDIAWQCAQLGLQKPMVIGGTKLCSTLSAHQSNLPRSRRHREDATS